MNSEYTAVTIIQYQSSIVWHISKSGSIDSSGTDQLSSTNGCYMSLLSNVMTECSNRCVGPVDEWIIRRG